MFIKASILAAVGMAMTAIAAPVAAPETTRNVKREEGPWAESWLICGHQYGTNAECRGINHIWDAEPAATGAVTKREEGPWAESWLICGHQYGTNAECRGINHIWDAEPTNSKRDDTESFVAIPLKETDGKRTLGSPENWIHCGPDASSPECESFKTNAAKFVK